MHPYGPHQLMVLLQQRLVVLRGLGSLLVGDELGSQWQEVVHLVQGSLQEGQRNLQAKHHCACIAVAVVCLLMLTVHGSW